MKHLKKRNILIALCSTIAVTTIFVVAARSKAEPKLTVIEIIQKEPSLTAFASSARATGVDRRLEQGSYTIFAPDNNALQQLPSQISNPELRTTLERHIVAGKASVAQLDKSRYLSTLNKRQIHLHHKNGTISVRTNKKDADDKNIYAHIIATYPAKNGVIYVIDDIIKQDTSQESSATKSKKHKSPKSSQRASKKQQ